MGRCRVFCSLRLGAMGRCRVRAICVWVSALVAAWWLVLAPAGTVLVSPGLHFESFVSLWGEPAAPGDRHGEQLKKVRKTKRLGSLIGSLLGHVLRSLPPKVEPACVLLRSFVSLFSTGFLAAFRSGFLEDFVESRRRPMCV